MRYIPGAVIAAIILCFTSYGATFTVTHTGISGSGSLTQAVTDANQNPGLDNIVFNIGSGPQTFLMRVKLIITDPVIIDGTTQPGYDGTPIIEITPDTSRPQNEWPVNGIELLSGQSTVRGLVINGYPGQGIYVSGSGGNVIEGNFFGTDFTGTQRRQIGNNCVYITGSSDNTVGGATPDKRNLLSGAWNAGVYIYSGSNNRVIGNYIGTDITGELAVANNTGVTLEGTGNRIGGPLPGERNIISGSRSSAVILASGSAHRVVNNYLGTNVSGTAALANSGGVYISGSANSVVGGLTAAERNVISGNTGNGVSFASGNTGNQLLGNYIGTDATGVYAIPNGGYGVNFINTRRQHVGASVPGAGNVISGNGSGGIYVYGGNPQPDDFSYIQGNIIGAAADGITPLPNNGNGLYFVNLARNVIVGSHDPIGGNRIVNHPGYGLRLGTFGNDIHGILIRSNTFSNNALLGISFSISGAPATNTYCNSGTNGPNYRQSYPTITSATRVGDSIIVRGEISSFPDTTYTIDVFACQACDPSGHGEGQYYLGYTLVNQPAGRCIQDFEATFPAPPAQFSVITATASNPNTVSTSEFSACFRVSGLSPFDFDGDGKSDISIYRPSSGQWWLERSTAGGVVYTFGNSADTIAPADFTGDGKTDIAIWRPASGEWFVLRSEDLTFFSFPFGSAGDVPVPADYDGDGKADAAVFRPSTGTWYAQRSTGGTLIKQFGTATDRPVPADYDGDGRTDLAIYRPSTGQWWLDRTTAGVVVYTFGNSTDLNVPGDYTGDGKADVAIYRGGTWFVLRSEDLSFYSFPFGNATDLPAPGDYDGDGKTDAAVFRPSEANWYIQRTSAGLLIRQYGASTDKPVPNAFVR